MLKSLYFFLSCRLSTILTLKDTMLFSGVSASNTRTKLLKETEPPEADCTKKNFSPAADHNRSRTSSAQQADKISRRP